MSDLVTRGLWCCASCNLRSDSLKLLSWSYLGRRWPMTCFHWCLFYATWLISSALSHSPTGQHVIVGHFTLYCPPNYHVWSGLETLLQDIAVKLFAGRFCGFSMSATMEASLGKWLLWLRNDSEILCGSKDFQHSEDLNVCLWCVVFIDFSSSSGKLYFGPCFKALLSEWVLDLFH